MKRFLSVILASLLFLSGDPVHVAQPAETSPMTRMLLIGCDYFVSQPNTAPVSENNVRTVEAAWKVGMPDTPDTPDTVCRVNTIRTAEDLRNAVDEAFSGSSMQDMNICYISTHGVLPENGDPAGMTLLFSDGVEEVNISPTELRGMLDTVPGRKLLILDSCYSGAVIGKGAPGLENAFDSPDYTVITSSGAAERSWFWSAAGDTETGVGYFTGALIQALNAGDGYPADLNRDGAITMTELKKTLENIHGVSAVRTWPEASDEALLKYDGQAENNETVQSALTGLTFDNKIPDPEAPVCRFSFTVNRPVRMIYRMVTERNGEWDFSDTSFLFDDAEDSGTVGMLTPGYKERTLSPGIPEDGDGGYVLLQVIGLSDGVPRLYGTHVICIPGDGSTDGNSIEMEILYPETVNVEAGMDIILRCGVPCAVTVAILDENDKVVCYPAVDQATRPEGIRPEGMTIFWDGCDRHGDKVSAGFYRIRIRLRNGDQTREILSESFEVVHADPTKESSGLFGILSPF